MLNIADRMKLWDQNEPAETFSFDLVTLKISYPRVYSLKLIRSEIPAIRLGGAQPPDIIP